MHGFDICETEERIARDWAAANPQAAPPGIRTKPPWRPFKDPARIWLNADRLPFPAFEQGMRGTYLANQAIEYLGQQPGNQPFALWVSFQEPHSP